MGKGGRFVAPLRGPPSVFPRSEDPGAAGADEEGL